MKNTEEKRIPLILDDVCEKEGFVIKQPRAVLLEDENIKITGHIKSERALYDMEVCVVAVLENADNEILTSDYDRAKFFKTSGIFDMEFSKYRIKGYVTDYEKIDHIRLLIGKSRTLAEAFS